jgi:DNA mismatch endonuclease (patch repair protein)
MSRDPAVTSRIMAAVRNRDTKPELMLRRELHRRGLRYRLRSVLFGKPDLVFPSARLAVFVDGDYWHGNTWRLRGYASLEAYCSTISNGVFWYQKISTNMSRDVKVNEELRSEGWRVLRIWESDIRASLEATADLVQGSVRSQNHATKGTPAT